MTYMDYVLSLNLVVLFGHVWAVITMHSDNKISIQQHSTRYLFLILDDEISTKRISVIYCNMGQNMCKIHNNGNIMVGSYIGV